MNILDRGVKVIRSEGYSTFLKSTEAYIGSEIKLAYDSLTIPALTGTIIKKIKEGSKDLKNTNELLEFSFNFRYMGFSIDPLQIRGEIEDFLKILSKRKTRRMLEIGTDRGGTLFLFTKLSEPNATIISLNLPFSKLNAWCMRYRNMIYAAFGTEKQKMHFISSSSHEENTLNQVKDILKSEKLDFLFIDGDHTYYGVKQDYEMYSPFVREGGIIAFHDITKNPSENESPVNKFWNEVKNKHKGRNEEICHGPNSLGIGVLYV